MRVLFVRLLSQRRDVQFIRLLWTFFWVTKCFIDPVVRSYKHRISSSVMMPNGVVKAKKKKKKSTEPSCSSYDQPVPIASLGGSALSRGSGPARSLESSSRSLSSPRTTPVTCRTAG